MKTKKPVNVRIVELSFEYGEPKYVIEREHVYLGILSSWKRDKVLIDSWFGVFDADREFASYIEAKSYIEANYKNYELLEPLSEKISCMW